MFRSLPPCWIASAKWVGCVVVWLVLATGCACRPLPRPAQLVGCFWALSAQPQTGRLDLDGREWDDLRRLGLSIVVLNGLVISEAPPALGSDTIEQLLAEGDRRRVRFFLETGAGSQWWMQPQAGPELARTRAQLRRLMDRYGHHRSFHGFYVPYESYVMWGAQRELSRALYRETAAACKAVAPGKPVLISPFFILDEEHLLGDFRWATPQEFRAYWVEVLQGSAIDIVALQDRGEHLSYYENASCAPFFAAMKSACVETGQQLWANVETGELAVDSPAAYEARFGRKTHVNDPRTQPFWRGVPADKLAGKLRFVSAYTTTAITWGYHEFVRPSLGSAAAGLYADYLRVLPARSPPNVSRGLP